MTRTCTNWAIASCASPPAAPASSPVKIDGTERARLFPGDFFGEVSILTGEAPTADIVATSAIRCAVLGEPEVETFLIQNPRVMLRMLQAEARRVRSANLWHE